MPAIVLTEGSNQQQEAKISEYKRHLAGAGQSQASYFNEHPPRAPKSVLMYPPYNSDLMLFMLKDLCDVQLTSYDSCENGISQFMPPGSSHFEKVV